MYGKKFCGNLLNYKCEILLVSLETVIFYSRVHRFMSFEIENEFKKTTKEKKHERYFDEFKLPTIFFMQSKFNISHVL